MHLINETFRQKNQTITQKTTHIKAPSKAITIAMQPENKFIEVILLGICFFHCNGFTLVSYLFRYFAFIW